MSDYTVVDIETSGDMPWNGELLCVGIGGNVWRPEKGRQMARMLMSKPGAVLVAHTNFDFRYLMLEGAKLGSGVQYHDTKVMAWMLDATQELALDALAQRYLGFTPPKPIKRVAGRIMFDRMFGSSTGTQELVPIEDVPWDEMVAYNQSDLRTEAELYEVLRGKLQEAGQWEYFLEEEAPFSKLLLEMEQAGVPYDAEAGGDMLWRVDAEADELRERLVDGTGAPDFNPGSGDQVADFVYGDFWKHDYRFAIPRFNGMSKDAKLLNAQLMAPSGKVTKVGRDYAYATATLDGLGLAAPPLDKDPKTGKLKKRPTVSGKVLNVMHGGHPWVADYVRWKKLTKLSSYLVDWQERVHNGRLHGRYDQSGTVTGRLAGRQPNLQQVAHGAEIRDLFRGDLVVGDYAGLEVRLSAHFSGDPVMLEIFREGKDLYGVLAGNAWGGPGDKSNEGRGLMKVIMLGSQYGARGQKLSEILAIAGMRGYTAHKANALLKDLQNTLPRLFEWREEVIEEAKNLGYVTTLAGRRRQLAGIGSADWKTMAKAERQAVNSKVQGSAADVVRRAMLEIRRRVRPYEARILLQVHDEILLQREEQWVPEVIPVIQEICERGHGFDLIVPLSFEPAVVTSWAGKGGSAGQVEAGAYAALGEALEAA
jgi:DNA polymerase I-like protein with 3'-5' exonuclease and polymerase domains